MIKAGIKKEFMVFSRGFRLIGVIITIIGIIFFMRVPFLRAYIHKTK